MTAPAVAVGVDVGASGIRVATQSSVAAFDDPLPRLNGHVDVGELVKLVAARVRSSSPGIGESLEVIAVGMAGFPDLVDSPEQLARALGSELSASRVVLAGDAYTSHVGALGYASGTVVAAGTGVISLGTDHATVWTRSDGWGLLLGDEGGGAWIGRNGLIAALRAADGRRGGSSLLLEALRERFGTEEKLVRELYGSLASSSLLGQFAPAVAAAASVGDQAACAIWEEAGAHLAASAIAASRGVGNLFSWAGGAFAAGDVLLDPFRAALLNEFPDADLRTPLGSSVEGALILAQLGAIESRPPFVEQFITG